ncbi:MAG: metal-dependent transcriptional regulator [Clostridiales bacterium]|nr:metal-dependent transcriptional regulator [Clostridiales bacterium]
MQESGEMYLENILILSGEKKTVRSIDVAERMGFSKPSVSRAMNILRTKGLISIDSFGAITLTDEGSSIANAIYERHRILTEVLMSLGVSEKTAAEDACRIEHYLSDETFEAVKKHIRERGSEGLKQN